MPSSSTLLPLSPAVTKIFLYLWILLSFFAQSHTLPPLAVHWALPHSCEPALYLSHYILSLGGFSLSCQGWPWEKSELGGPHMFYVFSLNVFLSVLVEGMPFEHSQIAEQDLNGNPLHHACPPKLIDSRLHIKGKSCSFPMSQILGPHWVLSWVNHPVNIQSLLSGSRYSCRYKSRISASWAWINKFF